MSAVPTTTPDLAGDSRARQTFRRALLRWFDRHQRPLPWRRDRHPYRVWVSEIMLQQTRVVAVLEHYARFLERFPTVEALAQAREEAVLAAWSGLGYYRRARALHAAAREVVRIYRGPHLSPAEPQREFPSRAAEWEALPGIGRYTAAAIASICFGEPCAVVDGNVERVLQRLLGKVSDLWALANRLLSRGRPGDFNQAMMELGAVVCLPGQPLCPDCPVSRWCLHGLRGGQREGSANPRSPRQKRELGCLLVCDGARILLERRGDHESLMPGMWELPAASTNSTATGAIMTLRHSILDTDYRVTVFPAEPAEAARAAAHPTARWCTLRQALALPLTGLARKILLRRDNT